LLNYEKADVAERIAEASPRSIRLASSLGF